MKRSKPAVSDPPAQPAPRLPLVDAARGAAVAMMIAYHFCYDLTHFGFARFDMLGDWRWIAWRNVIVTAFLLLVGVSLVLAQLGSQRGYWRRLAQVGGCAILVSVVSWVMFAERFIYFGILHFIVAASLLARPALRLGRWAAVLGLLLIVLGTQLHWPEMDPRALNWIGFAAHKPPTEDYTPLLPWLGVVLIGIGLAALWQRRSFRVTPQLDAAAQRTPRWLGWLGRHSLVAYMLHQPVLMAGLGLVRFAVDWRLAA